MSGDWSSGRRNVPSWSPLRGHHPPVTISDESELPGPLPHVVSPGVLNSVCLQSPWTSKAQHSVCFPSTWSEFLLRKNESEKVFIAQSCPTLCDPVDCCLPGSSVHGSLQERILEWAAPVQLCAMEVWWEVCRPLKS